MLINGGAMPYFVERRENKYCVIKGTKSEPGEVERCYSGEDAEAKAQALKKALYANVEHKSEKAEWSGSFINNLPDSSFLYVESGGEKDSEGKTTPRSKRHLPVKDASGSVDLAHVRNALSRLGQPATGKGWLSSELREKLITKAKKLLGKSKFISYKTDSGQWRWTSISSVAIMDKEKEIVSEKAYDDAVQYALESNRFGELDVIHVNGTEVGDCDMMARLGFQLVESGTWRNTDKARMVRSKISEDPDNWGVSIQFKFDPKQFDGTTYQGGIQITKRAVLPRSLAASYGTAIAIQGGHEMFKMTDEKKEVLRDMGFSEEDIESFAEKNKDTDPNVKHKEKKEEEIEEKVEEKVEPTLRSRAWSAFTNLFGEPQTTQPDVVENKTEDPAKISVEVEEKKEDKTEDKVEDKTDDKVDDDETTKNTMVALFTTMAEETSKAIQKSIAPLQEKIISLESRLLESEKSIEEKVLTRLAELPPVVKVQPTIAAPVTNIPVEGEVMDGKESQTKVFVDAVADLIGKGLNSGGSMPKFDL
jgi:hypothetical protein